LSWQVDPAVGHLDLPGSLWERLVREPAVERRLEHPDPACGSQLQGCGEPCARRQGGDHGGFRGSSERIREEVSGDFTLWRKVSGAGKETSPGEEEGSFSDEDHREG
jgi:hypothetical protein